MIKKLVSIYGIRRSGNHAIANWIMSHFNSGCYINDANWKVRSRSNQLPCHNINCKLTNLDDNPEIVIIGIENKLNRHIHKRYLEQCVNTENYEICLIRNCGNLIASHLKAWGDQSYHEKIPEHWKQYIDFYSSDSRVNLLVYDKWLDTEYKNEIALKIKFDNKGLGVEEIPGYGGGSSFNDTVVNVPNLRNRWKSMIDSERFLNIMNKFQYWDDHIQLFGKDDIYHYFHSNNS